MPKAETVLWYKLGGGQLEGIKFRRQHSIGPYIMDFYCAELKLAIGIDGESHFLEGSAEYDARRQAYIEGFGVRFLRFTNLDVLHNIDGVLLTIQGVIRDLRQI